MTNPIIIENTVTDSTEHLRAERLEVAAANVAEHGITADHIDISRVELSRMLDLATEQGADTDVLGYIMHLLDAIQDHEEGLNRVPLFSVDVILGRDAAKRVRELKGTDQDPDVILAGALDSFGGQMYPDCLTSVGLAARWRARFLGIDNLDLSNRGGASKDRIRRWDNAVKLRKDMEKLAKEATDLRTEILEDATGTPIEEGDTTEIYGDRTGPLILGMLGAVASQSEEGI